MKYRITDSASDSCKGFHPTQVCFFVMSDRTKGAVVTEVHFSADTAKRHARMYGTVCRVGRLAGSRAEGTFHAETICKPARLRQG